jgi:hypothetical protein
MLKGFAWDKNSSLIACTLKMTQKFINGTLLENNLATNCQQSYKMGAMEFHLLVSIVQALIFLVTKVELFQPNGRVPVLSKNIRLG